VIAERKPRPDKKLAALSEEQAAELFGWMRSGASYAAIRLRVAKEFRLDVSTRALSEFWEERVTEETTERNLRAVGMADKFGDLLAEKLPTMTKALKADLTQKALELSLTGGDMKAVEAMMSIVGGMNAAELQRAKIQLDLEKFRESIKTQQEKALDALFADVRGNAVAEQLFFKFRDAVRGAVEEAK
jgi:hypothetical protein